MEQKKNSDEIEITPEMIKAGRRAFDDWATEWDYFVDGIPGSSSVSDAISAIFRSMISVSPDLSLERERERKRRQG